jgi:hypothetical protein
MATRRELKFATLDEAVRDAEILLARGYDRAGNWDLAQCCHHLAVLMAWPIDGFPQMAWPRRAAACLLKRTIARRWLRKVLESGVWPAGTPTNERTFPVPGFTATEAVVMLGRAVDRLVTHAGPLREAQLFGMLDKETLLTLHRIHSAHHLSFLVPKRSCESIKAKKTIQYTRMARCLSFAMHGLCPDG